ncbi:MAG: hypothetical protein WCF85_16330 [Rhodospirillaceae bacterium]
MAAPIRGAGYTVHHRDTVLVGGSIVSEATRLLNQGCPVVLCGTRLAVGDIWARQIINAARSGSHLTKVFPVRLDKRADLDSLVGAGIPSADCSVDFNGGMAALLKSLTHYFPLTEEPPPPGVNICPWLTALVDRIGHIEISGIGSGVGKTKDASRYPIEQLYTTLRSHGGDSQSVADLLPKHRLLLIEGQPGAGKRSEKVYSPKGVAKNLTVLLIPNLSIVLWRRRWPSGMISILIK